MKIKDGYILRKIADIDIVVPVGNNIADFNGIISLNQTAAFLWRQLKEGAEISVMIDALIDEYQISRDMAQKDVEKFITQLQDANILDEVGKGVVF